MNRPTHRFEWLSRPSPTSSAEVRAWLMRPRALTAGLRKLGTVQLKVLQQRVTRVRADDAQTLKLAAGSQVWTREIAMSVNGEWCVVARSVLPLKASKGSWKAVRGLQTRPLAEILYRDKTIRRSDFDMCRVSMSNRLHPVAMSILGKRPFHAPYARRSVFWRNGQPILVAECFLPSFWSLLKSASADHQTD